MAKLNTVRVEKSFGGFYYETTTPDGITYYAKYSRRISRARARLKDQWAYAHKTGKIQF